MNDVLRTRYDKKQGLGFSRSKEEALKDMGYEPEQSIINGRDKAPIRFNAFRNAIYRSTEAHLNENNLLLEYGASKRKNPSKNASVNQPLKNWQDNRWLKTKRVVEDLQKDKNTIIEYDMTPVKERTNEDVEKIMNNIINLESTLEDVSEESETRIKKDMTLVRFNQFDQLHSFMKSIRDVLNRLKDKYNKLQVAFKKLEKENILLKKQNENLKNENNELIQENEELLDYINYDPEYEKQQRTDATLKRMHDR